MEGFEAIVFQHELDHLNGVLLIDRVKESGGKFFKIEKDKMVPAKLQEV
jgi:peptide deformylase